MQKIKIVILVLAFVGIIVAAAFFVIGFVNPKKAGIVIETIPTSIIFINGEQVGKTPFEQTREGGEVTIKLVPETFEKPLPTYETKVDLTVGVKTIIQRSFGEYEESTSGVIVSFEKEGEKTSSISIVSVPDNCKVKIDDRVVGFTPHKSTDVVAGEHKITVSSAKYREKSLKINTFEGFKLTAIFKLEVDPEVKKKEEGLDMEIEDVVENVDRVKILETSVGFLRVRQEPSTLAPELAQVKPGEEFVLLDEDEKTGWYKIEYEQVDGKNTAKEGWITNIYAEKLSESSKEEDSQ